jgi:hypothetical protein
VPTLEFVHEHGGPLTLTPVGHIAEATGIESTEVADELDSLIAAATWSDPS